MRGPRTTVGARIALVSWALVAVAAALLPAVVEAGIHAVLAVADAVRTIGHGALEVEDGLVLAAVVSVATVPVPGLVAGASRASRPMAVRTATAWAALAVVLAVSLVAARSATPVATWVSLVLAVVVGLLLGALLLACRRELRAGWHGVPGGSSRSRRVALTVIAAYGVGVAVVGFAGSPVDAGAHPFLLRALDALHRSGLPDWFGYAATEATANVLFFLPLGVLVVLLLGVRWWWVGVVAGVLMSLVIEVGQTLFLPARFGSVDDVLANSAGAAIGAMLGVVVLGWAARRRAEATPVLR